MAVDAFGGSAGTGCLSICKQQAAGWLLHNRHVSSARAVEGDAITHCVEHAMHGLCPHQHLQADSETWLQGKR